MNVDPLTGSKFRKGQNGNIKQIIVVKDNTNDSGYINCIIPRITKTIEHWRN